MLPEQLRVPKRRETDEDATPTTSSNSPNAPMRLSDMLKRKRVSKRSTNNSRKSRDSNRGEDMSASTSALAFDMQQSSSSQNETPTRRSKLADR